MNANEPLTRELLIKLKIDILISTYPTMAPNTFTMTCFATTLDDCKAVESQLRQNIQLQNANLQELQCKFIFNRQIIPSETKISTLVEQGVKEVQLKAIFHEEEKLGQPKIVLQTIRILFHRLKIHENGPIGEQDAPSLVPLTPDRPTHFDYGLVLEESADAWLRTSRLYSSIIKKLKDHSLPENANTEESNQHLTNGIQQLKKTSILFAAATKNFSLITPELYDLQLMGTLEAEPYEPIV